MESIMARQSRGIGEKQMVIFECDARVRVYNERETRRRDADKLVSNGATLEEKVGGAVTQLDALHERSLLLHNQDQRRSRHPDFPKFVRWLDLEWLFPADVAAAVRAHYGAYVPGKIASRDSYWRG
jgi:hypothetical protein